MFNGIKNSFNSSKKTTKDASSTILNIIKEIPKLPWKKLPLIGWAYIVIAIAIFSVIIFIIMPRLNF